MQLDNAFIGYIIINAQNERVATAKNARRDDLGLSQAGPGVLSRHTAVVSSVTEHRVLFQAIIALQLLWRLIMALATCLCVSAA